jgi:hypothetical protein
MKRQLILLLALVANVSAALAQYTPIVYGTLATDNYTTVNRKYFTVPTASLNDGQAHLLSIMELSREMARASAGVGIYATPAISSTPATYTPPTLTNPNFSGPFVPPAARFSITKVHYSPVACNGKNLRLIIVRPNDAVVRPCIMVSHGKGGDLGNYATYFFHGADYLLRGYVVAFYENSEAANVQVYPNLDCASPFWPTLQQSIYQGYQYAVAVTKYMKCKASDFGEDKSKFFASGVSFGSICSMMLAYADAGNFNHPTFAEAGGSVNFNAKTYAAYQGEVVTDIKSVAPIATGIPLPGTGNLIGNIFDAGDAGTSTTFIHGRMETLFKLATTAAPFTPITDYPAGCTLAGVKVETPLALIARMTPLGIQGKAVIHCDADHGSITFAAPIDATYFSDPFLSNIDFDTNPTATFGTKNQEWLVVSYLGFQCGGYINVIAQQFRAKIDGFVPLRPSSPDGIDGVRPASTIFFWPFTVDGTLLPSNCGYSNGSVAFKAEAEGETPTMAARLALSPNPSLGQVTAHHQAADATNMTIEVLTLQGTRVHSAKIPEGSTTTKMDLAHLPTGLYFVQLQDGKGHFTTTKLILR